MVANQELKRVAVALDTSERAEFVRWCELFGSRVGVLKVGLEAFVRWGPWAIEKAQEAGRKVFADLKLHDIPNTVSGAVTGLRDLSADYLTVHAAGGPRMLEAAVAHSGEKLCILAVTLLTHLDREALDKLGLDGRGSQRVLDWAKVALAAGCHGAVCSPLELAALRQSLPDDFLLVTPGIRPHGRPEGDDQRRMASPGEALAEGSDLLVIGRPLTRAKDPERALKELARAIRGDA